MIDDFEYLRGRKVLLRKFTQSDITPEYISWLNDPEVVQFSNQRFIQHTEYSCRLYFDNFANSTNLFLSVSTRVGNVPIGTMTAYVSPYHGTVDIGILLGNKSVWGKGYGQDAWSLLVDWFIKIKKIRKITAGTLSVNKSMIRIMERSGMICEAVRERQEFVAGELCDIYLFAKFSDLRKS